MFKFSPKSMIDEREKLTFVNMIFSIEKKKYSRNQGIKSL